MAITINHVIELPDNLGKCNFVLIFRNICIVWPQAHILYYEALPVLIALRVADFLQQEGGDIYEVSLALALLMLSIYSLYEQMSHAFRKLLRPYLLDAVSLFQLAFEMREGQMAHIQMSRWRDRHGFFCQVLLHLYNKLLNRIQAEIPAIIYVINGFGFKLVATISTIIGRVVNYFSNLPVITIIKNGKKESQQEQTPSNLGSSQALTKPCPIHAGGFSGNKNSWQHIRSRELINCLESKPGKYSWRSFDRKRGQKQDSIKLLSVGKGENTTSDARSELLWVSSTNCCCEPGTDGREFYPKVTQAKNNTERNPSGILSGGKRTRG
ncbi:hypothetical protein FGO68_gene10087 [Halteria grandinella]|uniref:Uncharacterized protein n=1 Tax=Halteria grandinella TaxID=5974 RepID=A0A8J8SXE4_HALGN|nr:hypothetical protein FGO68_gene10087 [Halteria grandinella]